MKARFILTLALLLICTGIAVAQTPDGLPPARETICDNETGAAYGLCNAYCEAMDCDSGSPEASSVACDKVRTKFQNVSGYDVTCELPCPCTSIPQFNATLAGTNSCVTYDFFGALVGTLVSPEPAMSFPFPPFFTEYAGAEVYGGGAAACGYIKLDSLGQPEQSFVLPITPEQAANCVQLAHDAAASRNVTCVQFP